MAGVCSRHHPSLGVVEGCDLCTATVADVLGISEGEYAAMAARAEAAGLFTCDCGFEYYKTVDACPACDRERKIILS